MFTSGSRSALLLLQGAVAALGCNGDIGDTSPPLTSGQGGAAAGATSGGGATSASASTATTAATSAGGAATTGAASSGSGASSTDVCTRWQTDRADLGEGSWSGSVNGCNAGDISATGRANALKLVNLYRFLATLPPVTTDATRDQGDQACALMMTANGQLSHSPPMSWTCYSSAGAQAAGSSNIASTAAVAAVDLYIEDPGNPTTMGHRRWVLSSSLGPIGIGSTSSFSCMWVTGGSGSAAPVFTAWPPAGDVPLAAAALADQTGWTIQSDAIDVSAAAVTITDGGSDRPVSVTALQAGYGSAYAIRVLPEGWQAQADHSYAVSVTGASQPIAYDVHVLACP